jgi:hypothetical protein
LCFKGQLFTVEFFCSDPENIFLTDGASKGVAQVLNALIRDEKDGVSLSFFNQFCFASPCGKKKIPSDEFKMNSEVS